MTVRLRPFLRFVLFAAIVGGGAYALDRDYVQREMRSERCPTGDRKLRKLGDSGLYLTPEGRFMYEEEAFAFKAICPVREEVREEAPIPTNDLEQAQSRLAQAAFGRPVTPDRSFYDDEARAVAAYLELVSPRSGLPHRIGYEPLLEYYPGSAFALQRLTR
jgi:hypothetical protein